MRTSPTCPLLVSLTEASFQLSLPEDDVLKLIFEGDIIAVNVSDRILVAYDSLVSFTRRVKVKYRVPLPPSRSESLQR